jgi:hypothetical protein
MTTKEEFLRLLEEDNEFRLAVAGFLGYGEILKRLEKHDRKFVRILKHPREHDKKFTEILNEIKQLKGGLQEVKYESGGHYWKHGEEMGRGSRENGARDIQGSLGEKGNRARES